MAEFTENINLKKPDLKDLFNIEDFNGNADIIDEQFGALKEKNQKTDEEIEGIKTTIENMGTSGGSGTHVGPDPPEDTQMLWIDTSDNGIMKYYNGTEWVPTKTTAVWGEG